MQVKVFHTTHSPKLSGSRTIGDEDEVVEVVDGVGRPSTDDLVTSAAAKDDEDAEWPREERASNIFQSGGTQGSGLMLRPSGSHFISSESGIRRSIHFAWTTAFSPGHKSAEDAFLYT
jgi:hypothetical protein